MSGEVPSVVGCRTHLRILSGAVVLLLVIQLLGLLAFCYRLSWESDLEAKLDERYVKLSDLTTVLSREFNANLRPRLQDLNGWPKGPEVDEDKRLRKRHARRGGRRRSAGIEDNSVYNSVDVGTGNYQQQSNVIPQVTNDSLRFTSYSELPLDTISDFCVKTLDKCPDGPVGPEGPKGVKGDIGPKGDRGFRGQRGMTGQTGPHGKRGALGMKGEQGQKGARGMAGMDGRKGFNGEHGLDGLPGRNGLDGIPGADGIPGRHGSRGEKGIDGKDGKNGVDGKPGPVGPRGLKGDRGLPGASGVRGLPGEAGLPGRHGICAYIFNKTDQFEVLVEPKILKTERENSTRRSVIVAEKDNVLLECIATGRPRPQIQWEREDGDAIAMGAWKRSGVRGDQLNITVVSRVHMGVYVCTADNGVGTSPKRYFDLQVYFGPFISTPNTIVTAFYRGTAVLQCKVEFFPLGVVYWEKVRDRKILEHGHKYNISKSFPDTSDGFVVTMTLRIMNFIEDQDEGEYYCVGKNVVAEEKGSINVYAVNPENSAIGPSRGTFGLKRPDLKSQHDLCPPACLDCGKVHHQMPCDPSNSDLYNFLKMVKINPYTGVFTPGPGKRIEECKISQVGKPVFHRDSPGQDYGTWMTDLAKTTDSVSGKVWATNQLDNKILYEYKNMHDFRNNNVGDRYKLPHPFQGTSHIMYNGSFYYHAKNSSNMVRFILKTLDYIVKPVAGATYKGKADLLYASQNSTYLDFNADENGLWLIYGLPGLNFTVVMKFSPENLDPLYMLNITINHHSAGEMFVACGVLYLVDSVEKMHTKIGIALDLYHQEFIGTDLVFTNPFKKSTLVAYNPSVKEIYTWDRGNQLTYPVKVMAMGYTDDGSKETIHNETESSMRYSYIVDRSD